MNLSLALNIPTGKTGAVALSILPGSQETALFPQGSTPFSDLLSTIAPQEGTEITTPDGTSLAASGKGLPDNPGNYLPVSPGNELPTTAGTNGEAELVAAPGPKLTPPRTLRLANDAIVASPPAITLAGRPNPIAIAPAKPDMTAMQAAPSLAGRPDPRLTEMPKAGAEVTPERLPHSPQVINQAAPKTQPQAGPQAAPMPGEFTLQLGLPQPPSLRGSVVQPVQTIAEALMPRQAAEVASPLRAAGTQIEPSVLHSDGEVSAEDDLETAPAATLRATTATNRREAGGNDAPRMAAALVEGEGDDVQQAPSRTAGAIAAASQTPATQTPALTIAAADAARGATATQTATQAGADAASPARHDFESIVDKLVEAREMSRSTRTDMQLTHRDFGRVSVQFEMAGQQLKVALNSNDAGFASSVQAAMAERPIPALAETTRSDGQPMRQDTSAQAGSQGSSHADAQRQDQQARSANGRAQGDQPQRLPRETGDQPSNLARRGRDGDLFA